MAIIGQFNLGFILGRLGQDLFILDQHACDEKANFEKLCNSTKLRTQPLLGDGIPMELSPAEEEVVLDNLPIFERFGFRIRTRRRKGSQPVSINHGMSMSQPQTDAPADGDAHANANANASANAIVDLVADANTASNAEGDTDPDATAGEDAAFEAEEAFPAGQRLACVGLPVSKNVTFGAGDVRDLANLILEAQADGYGPYHAEGSASENELESLRTSQSTWLAKDLFRVGLRLPKMQRMLASRACRKSVMIGTALDATEQKRVVSQMASVEQPWNCPHGRPTLRHLVNLEQVETRRQERSKIFTGR